ncbi:MAG: hypothetical protein HJHJAOHD_02443 [Flavobacteriales bacterium]|nr:hypothetical protein [Flavobacteriales bacterium]
MKPTKLLYLLTIFLFLLPVSCKKKKEDDLFREKTIVNGRVLDYYTGFPAEGVKIVLVEKEPVLYGHPYDYILTRKDSVYTDPVGFFTFSFRAKIGEKYTYYVFHPTEGDYFNGGEKNISKNTENSLNFSLKGRTRFIKHIKNINPVNNNDVFQIGGLFLYGINIDTIIYSNNYTDSFTLNLTWFVTKNSVTDTFNVSIFCPYKQTTTYEIFY